MNVKLQMEVAMLFDLYCVAGEQYFHLQVSYQYINYHDAVLLERKSKSMFDQLMVLFHKYRPNHLNRYYAAQREHDVQFLN